MRFLRRLPRTAKQLDTIRKATERRCAGWRCGEKSRVWWVYERSIECCGTLGRPGWPADDEVKGAEFSAAVGLMLIDSMGISQQVKPMVSK